jgi:small subunit ribosomal protein S13
MARIAGVDLPRNKRVEIGLTYIYGIGVPTSKKILAQARVSPDTRIKDLSEAEVGVLRDIIEKQHKVEGDLRREVSMSIKRLTEIGCYRGLRHRRICRCMARTRTNARTKRGVKDSARARPARGPRKVIAIASGLWPVAGCVGSATWSDMHRLRR